MVVHHSIVWNNRELEKLQCLSIGKWIDENVACLEDVILYSIEKGWPKATCFSLERSKNHNIEQQNQNEAEKQNEMPIYVTWKQF